LSDRHGAGWLHWREGRGCGGWHRLRERRQRWHGLRGEHLRDDKPGGRELRNAAKPRQAERREGWRGTRRLAFDGGHARGEVPHLAPQPIDGRGESVEGVGGNGGEWGLRHSGRRSGDDGGGGRRDQRNGGGGVGMAAEAPGPDIDTRLLELGLLRRGYEWEVDGRGLNARRRTGGAVLGA
jgi:hypothetical protein